MSGCFYIVCIDIDYKIVIYMYIIIIFIDFSFYFVLVILFCVWFYWFVLIEWNFVYRNEGSDDFYLEFGFVK